MTYENFHKAIQNLKRFMDEQDKLKAVLQVISPSGTGVVDLIIEEYGLIGEESEK